MSSTRAIDQRAATRKKEMQALLDTWGLGAQTTLFVELGVVDVRDFAEYVLDEDIEKMEMPATAKCAALSMLKSLRMQPRYIWVRFGRRR